MGCGGAGQAVLLLALLQWAAAAGPGETLAGSLSSRRHCAADSPGCTTGQVTEAAGVEEWVWNASSIALLAAHDEPAVFRSSSAHPHPGKRWAAAVKWTPEHLRQHLPPLVGVRETREGNGHFHYCLETALMADTLGYAPHCYRKVALTAAEYFASVAEGENSPPPPPPPPPPPAARELESGEGQGVAAATSSPRHYYSGAIGKWGEEFEADVMPVAALVFPLATAAADAPGPGAAFFKTYTWVGQGGAVTPLHYDVMHNLHYLLAGAKRVVLYPPAHAGRLFLFPYGHPGRRSSQLVVSDPAFAGLDRGGLDGGLEVWLGPGDLLYIPPLWLHHVTTLELSIAVNVWSDYTPSRLIDFALVWPLDWALNFLQNTEDGFEQVAHLRLFLDLLLQRLGFEGGAGKALIQDSLLETRFALLAAQHGLPDEALAGPSFDADQPTPIEHLSRFCHVAEARETSLRDGFAMRQLGLRVEELGANLTRIKDLAGEARQREFLLDLIEATVGAFFDWAPDRIVSFLADYTRC